MNTFEITTNHKTALSIKNCFDSRIYSYEINRQMRLVNITVEKGHVVITIEKLKNFNDSRIFFLGMNTETFKNDNNHNFDVLGLLPLERAKELLTLKRPVNV